MIQVVVSGLPALDALLCKTSIVQFLLRYSLSLKLFTSVGVSCALKHTVFVDSDTECISERCGITWDGFFKLGSHFFVKHCK